MAGKAGDFVNLVDPKLKAFLDLIAWSEGTITGRDDGYGVIVTGVDGPSFFVNYSDHPFANGRPPVIWRTNPIETSTASGRYQLELEWWTPYKTLLHLPDFSPASQDAVALQQMRERHAIAAILAGDIQEAIMDCSNIWASFPGNGYKEAGGKTMEELLAQYDGSFRRRG
jgi:muramidase (phage lysozyme)